MNGCKCFTYTIPSLSASKVLWFCIDSYKYVGLGLNPGQSAYTSSSLLGLVNRMGGWGNLGWANCMNPALCPMAMGSRANEVRDEHRDQLQLQHMPLTLPCLYHYLVNCFSFMKQWIHFKRWILGVMPPMRFQYLF